MPAKLFTFSLITMLLAISLAVYAGDSKECPAATTISKTYCKALATLCKFKSCKVHSSSQKPHQKVQEKGNTGSSSPNPANTYETIIAPFIKTIAPHFYERILKKEDTKLPEAMRSRDA